jgi:lysophospholipase L1-like esterase
MLIGKRGKRWLASLGLLAASLGLVFVVCEIGIRIVESSRHASEAKGESWAIYDEKVGYRPRPNFGDANAHGLRGKPVDMPKHRFRILLLGDSVIYYGDDADDTIPAQVERVIAAKGNLAKSEVLNAGVRGYTNYQELRFLEQYGLAVEPDLVGVAFVLNDLHRILHRFKVEDGKIVGQHYAFADDAIRSVDSPLYRLARKSRFLVWLRRQLAVFDTLIDLYAGRGFTFDYRPDFNTAWREDSWHDIEAQLAEMTALGAKHGFRVFLVAIPFGDQLRSDYVARNRDYVMYPQRKLAEITRRLDIPYLDLYPVLDLARDFDPDRVHLSKSGRALAGERIAQFLMDERLVPLAAQRPPARVGAP